MGACPLSRLLGVGFVKELINAVKRLAVSTGKLSALLHLHIRPINLVVFQGTFEQLLNET